jgi:outer membrane protein assembly factor BamA
VGYAAGLRPYSSDSTTEYHRKWLQFNPLVLWRVRPNFYLGGSLDFNRTVASHVSPRMAADPSYMRFGSRNANAGAGFALQYDTRDVTVNAWRGSYLGLAGTFYGSYLGGDNGYQIFQIDYRRYHPLGRPGRTLAWQVKARIGAGDVPWAELPLLGTVNDLRGYLDGRFRDRSTLLGLIEYRHTFMRSGGRLSRHGFVTWIGGGTLGRDPGHFVGFLPNAGAGYRFELQPRSNIRMDIGVGRHAHGVYFNFTEAF